MLDASHLQERRSMMQSWADYLDALREAKVVPFGVVSALITNNA